MKIEPLEQYILAELEEHELKKENGLLVVVEGVKGKTSEAVVVAAGPGQTLADGSIRPMSISIGDRILIPNDAGWPTKVDGKKHAVLKEEDVIAIIE